MANREKDWGKEKKLFQSFFYWNCLGGFIMIDFDYRYVLVSILLLLELPWWPFLVKIHERHCLMFQSFFYWNCLGGISWAADINNTNYVSILLLLELPWWPSVPRSSELITVKFQSFFYWNCLGGYQSRPS